MTTTALKQHTPFERWVLKEELKIVSWNLYVCNLEEVFLKV